METVQNEAEQVGTGGEFDGRGSEFAAGCVDEGQTRYQIDRAVIFPRDGESGGGGIDRPLSAQPTLIFTNESAAGSIFS